MCHFQNNFVKFLGIIYLIHNTQLCKLRLWHMSRFSARSHEWFRERFSWRLLFQAAAKNCGPVLRWPDCSASRSRPTQPNRVQIFFSSAGISGFWDQTLLLTGGPSRRAAVTTAPAPGPEGNTLPVASLSWQILKTWLSSGHFCSLFVHRFVLINKILFFLKKESYPPLVVF